MLNCYRFICLITAVMLIGCAPSLKMTNNQISSMKPEEGQVFGSIQITLRDDNNNSIWVASIEGTKWLFMVDNSNRTWPQKVLSQERFELDAIAGAEESFFVAKLPAGEYAIKECSGTGLLNNMRSNLDIHFKVEPGKTIYIGKLIVEFPKYNNPYALLYNCKVENKQAEALSMLNNSYNNLGKNIETGLMQAVRK
jgi:hypothetical protein